MPYQPLHLPTPTGRGQARASTLNVDARYRPLWLILSVLLYAVLISGCVNTIRSDIAIIADPGFNFNRSLAIRIEAKAGKHALESKHYLDVVAHMLRAFGFSQVNVDDGHATATDNAGRNALSVELETKRSVKSITRSVPRYEYVNSGEKKSVCTKVNNTVTCHEKEKKEYRQVGNQKKTFREVRRSVDVVWFTHDRKKILTMQATTSKSRCSDDTVYRLLIDEIFKRLSFSRPVRQTINIRLADDINC